MYSWQQERRDLGDGWYAVKLPTERFWTLKRDGVTYVSGSIRALEEWIRVREEWRRVTANQP